MSDKLFYQDFLFRDLPVDEQENLLIDIEYYDENSESRTKKISFDKLIRMNRLDEWNKLYSEICGKTVVIIDDVIIINNELSGYKDFYLKTYYYKTAYKKQKTHCFLLLKKFMLTFDLVLKLAS